MPKNNFPVTQATRTLKQKGVHYIPHLYSYIENGGTKQTATELDIDEHSVVKTLVMEDADSIPFIILMHGDMEVSTKELARTIGTKTVKPCSPEKATKFTGYLFGGTSPFGTRRNLPVYIEDSVFELDRMFVNGGKRGFIIEMNPSEIRNVIKVSSVRVGI